jgi:hypothetical protein
MLLLGSIGASFRMTNGFVRYQQSANAKRGSKQQQTKDKTMKIITVKNEHNATVYHVEDDGCIQEFWSYKEAKAYVDYVTETTKG